MEGGNNSSTQGGQLELKKLLRNADVSVDGFIWCFGNVSLFPAFDESSSTSSSVLAFNLLQQLQERQDNGGGSTKSRVRNCSNNAFRLGNPYSGCRTRRSRSATACAHTLMKMGYPKNEGIVNSGSSYTVGDHSCSPEAQSLNHSTNMFISSNQESNPSGHGWIEKAAMASQQAKEMMKEISILEKARIGAGAGAIAGAITYAVLHPLDTVKTKLQTRGASHLYSGPLDVVVKTFRNQGVLGFYPGISAVLIGSTFSSGVYFGMCELGKALLIQLPSLPSIMVPPLAGILGNVASSAIMVPKELITQRMQAGAQGRSWEVFLAVLEKEGVMGLYTGYSAALVRNLPASVLSFSSFEYLKSAWMKKNGRNNLDPWQSVLSGALAGAVSSALTTPLDVVKTRLMTQARAEVFRMGPAVSSSIAIAELQAKIAASTYKGISSTLRKIWIEEGWMGLTRGMIPRILYSACFSAIGYFAFETARLALVKQHLAKKRAAAIHAY